MTHESPGKLIGEPSTRGNEWRSGQTCLNLSAHVASAPTTTLAKLVEPVHLSAVPPFAALGSCRSQTSAALKFFPFQLLMIAGLARTKLGAGR